ncbi:MAG: hypothetical protein ACON42_00475 [Flavobacteriaceae bacterium]
MNQRTTTLLSRFIVLLLLQLLFFNHWVFFDAVFPSVYIFFVMSYPFEAKPQEVILSSFLLGLSLDVLSQSPGAHTIATLTIATLRPAAIAVCLGLISDFSSIFSRRIKNLNLLLFILLMTWIHQIIYFSVLYFTWEAWLQIIGDTIVHFLVSSLFIYLTLSLYTRDDS